MTSGTDMRDKISLLLNKHPKFFEITGKMDSNGYYTEDLPYTVNDLNREITYYVSLMSFDGDAMFPNLTTKNNKLHYRKADNSEHFIELYPGAYKLGTKNTFNEKIHEKLAIGSAANQENISISLDDATARTKLELKNDYKVDFTKLEGFGELLGFDKRIIDKSCYSDHVADIFPIKKIYIYCDLVRGTNFKGRPEQILYAFSNKYGYAAPITERPNPREYRLLDKYEFTGLTFWAKDQDEVPVDFGGCEFRLSLEIRPS